MRKLCTSQAGIPAVSQLLLGQVTVVQARHAGMCSCRRGPVVALIGELAWKVGLHLGPEHRRRAMKERIVYVLL